MSLVFGLGGCSTHQVNRAPAPPLPDLPDKVDPELRVDQAQWWLTFADPELTQLIETSLKANLRQRQSWTRVAQSAALARASDSSVWPTLNLSLDPSITNSARKAADGSRSSQWSRLYKGSLGASYELDFWGKATANRRAAAEDLQVAQLDYEAAAITLAAAVTERWFDILENRELQQLLIKQIEVAEEILIIAEHQFQANQTSLSDVLQQKIQLDSLVSKKIGQSANELASQLELATLVGVLPKPILSNRRQRLPGTDGLPELAIPISTIRNRPDVRAAERRVVSADYRTESAIAAQFPSISIGVSTGLSSATLLGLLDSLISNFLISIGGPLFDGGRLKSEVSRTSALTQDALLGYGATLLSAILELEQALVHETKERAQLGLLRSQNSDAVTSLRATLGKYRQGLGSYLNVLTSAKTLQDIQQSMISSRRRILSLRLTTLRAAGGQWTQRLISSAETTAP